MRPQFAQWLTAQQAEHFFQAKDSSSHGDHCAQDSQDGGRRSGDTADGSSGINRLGLSASGGNNSQEGQGSGESFFHGSLS